MTVYFDHVAFYGDVLAYATRNDHGPADLRRETGIDYRACRRVWDVHEHTLHHQGPVCTHTRLAVYADLSLDHYVKEKQWTKREKRKVLDKRRSERASALSQSHPASAPPAQVSLEEAS
jgi:hypothetical protein